VNTLCLTRERRHNGAEAWFIPSAKRSRPDL
jgi:hypothetical protein